MNNTATSKVPKVPANPWIAAAASTTAVVTSAKHGSSGQKWLLVYAPSSGPAIRSVSTAPTMA